MQRRVAKLLILCSIAVAASGVCGRSARSSSSGWHITSAAAGSRHGKGNLELVTRITNTSSSTRWAAFRIEDPECDPDEWYKWTWINITDGDGNVVFDGFSCDVLRFDVPAKQLLRVKIYTSDTSILGVTLQ
jgi:hypothetical protein